METLIELKNIKRNIKSLPSSPRVMKTQSISPIMQCMIGYMKCRRNRGFEEKFTVESSNEISHKNEFGMLLPIWMTTAKWSCCRWINVFFQITLSCSECVYPNGLQNSQESNLWFINMSGFLVPQLLPEYRKILVELSWSG